MRGGRVERREKGGARMEISLVVIPTRQHGGNLAAEIRYDYRESELRGCSSRSNQRRFEAVSR